MEKIFYKKGTSILVIAAILVIVLLLCMLLTFLAQQAAFDKKVEYVKKLISQAQEDAESQTQQNTGRRVRAEEVTESNSEAEATQIRRYNVINRK